MHNTVIYIWPRWSCGLRYMYAAAWLLGSRVRILLRALRLFCIVYIRASVKKWPIVQRISAEHKYLTVSDLETSKTRQPMIDAVSCITKKWFPFLCLHFSNCENQSIMCISYLSVHETSQLVWQSQQLSIFLNHSQHTLDKQFYYLLPSFDPELGSSSGHDRRMWMYTDTKYRKLEISLFYFEKAFKVYIKCTRVKSITENKTV